MFVAVGVFLLFIVRPLTRPWQKSAGGGERGGDLRAPRLAQFLHCPTLNLQSNSIQLSDDQPIVIVEASERQIKAHFPKSGAFDPPS